MAKKESFEHAMARLEEIVSALESGDATLDESMKLLEEGTRLSAQCADQLEKARQKITVLTAPAEGQSGKDETEGTAHSNEHDGMV